ncbi:MAG: type II toxin-antitoxin system VapC family toxin [Pseudonocardia sp.]|nr:type II toxin-antitoxin system VapC family toxin [Pseudonocardia sp.]
MPVVVDASALAEVVLRTERAAVVEELIEDESLVAPDLIGAEVLSVENLVGAPVRRMTTGPLVAAMWSLHANVTPYDASYVVLARMLDAPLVTLDERLIRAPGLPVVLRTPRVPRSG